MVNNKNNNNQHGVPDTFISTTHVYIYLTFKYYYEAYTTIVVSIAKWLTLCDPINCSPPDSSVHGISQARILKRVAIPFSR